MLKNIWRGKIVWKNQEYGMKRYSVLVIAVCLNILMFCKLDVRASDETKIHFIALDSYSDAILLESNGKYGMIDSGEDWNFPTGEDFRYPAREGITRWTGYEQQVIHYLEEVGVEELELYITTHAYSDHICKFRKNCAKLNRLISYHRLLCDPCQEIQDDMPWMSFGLSRHLHRWNLQIVPDK